MVLRLLAQLKRASDFNEVFRGVAVWAMPTVEKDGLAFRLTVRMNPYGRKGFQASIKTFRFAVLSNKGVSPIPLLT